VPTVATDILTTVSHALYYSDVVLAVIEQGADGTLIVQQVNAGFARAFGASVKELEGQPFASMAVPDQAEKLASLGAAASRGESLRTEIACVRPNGERMWLGLTMWPASRPAYPDNLFVIMARDITRQMQDSERRNAVQQLLATVFAAAEAALAIVGTDGRVLMTNACCDRLLGFPPNALVGRLIVELAAADDQAALTAARDQQSADKRRFSIELSLTREDQAHLPVTMVWAFVARGENELCRVVTIIQRGAAARPPDAPRTQVGGKIRLVSLEEIKMLLGEKWESTVERVMTAADGIVGRMMLPGDSYFRSKDLGFVFSFANDSEEQATIRAAAIAKEIRHALIKAGEDPAGVEVSAMVAPLPRLPGKATYDRAMLESRVNEHELMLMAIPVPPVGTKDLILERVIGKEASPPFGYFARPIWPPLKRGDGTVASLSVQRFRADLAALASIEKVALEQMEGGTEKLFVEIDFDCFFSRERTVTITDMLQKFAQPAKERAVIMLANIIPGVAMSRVLDSVQRLKPFCRAVGSVIDTPDLPAAETTATFGTFVLFNSHAWDRSKTVLLSRTTKLCAGLNARKTALIVRGVTTAANRDALRECGVKLFSVPLREG